MTREQLIEVCERAVVDVKNWSNRDSSDAQLNIGEAWILLRCGAKFIIDEKMSDARTTWIRFQYPGFGAFDYDGVDEQKLCYLPTAERLEREGDWY